MVLQIEPKTRQFIGLLVIGGAIIAMIFNGLIPAPEYQKYVGMLLGALFYHIVRMLNWPTAAQDKPQQPIFIPQMSLASSAANPTQELPK